MRSNLLGDLPSVNNVNGRIGYGFGLTFAVNLGIDKTGAIGSKGEYNWGGAAGTAFWVDPKEDMIGIFMVQVMPQRTVKDQFKQACLSGDRQGTELILLLLTFDTTAVYSVDSRHLWPAVGAKKTQRSSVHISS